MLTELLCELWEPARMVLKHQFPGVPLIPDVRELKNLPPVDLVTAGFPCTDLSQAGRCTGITGEASGLVGEAFRLLGDRRVPWVLLENVRNMLVLDGGTAMRFLISEFEDLGYRWAYRLVDSRFTGVPQRRQRVILVATTEGDPREVLFADDAGEPDESYFASNVYGFYWSEGLRGLGWARDAVPPIKSGPRPAIWNPQGPIGRRIVTPTIRDAEQIQGFDTDWTNPTGCVSATTRWRLVGNAVTVGVSEWVARRLVNPRSFDKEVHQLDTSARWPNAAYGANGKRWAVDVSMWPTHEPYQHLSEVVNVDTAPPLSKNAAAGFYKRAMRGNLRFAPGFLEDVVSHIEFSDY
jgi:DNA (cytosine-5)-methyltransferase 1